MTDAQADPNPDGTAFYVDGDGDEVLDVRALRPRGRKIRIETAPGESRVFVVDGSLAVDAMITLYDHEMALLEAKGDEARRRLAAVNEGLTDLLRETNEDVPDLALGKGAALSVMAWLAGNSSVAQAFVDAITAAGLGRSGGEKPDAASDNARALAEDAGVDAAEGDGPLPSASRSRSRSSRSAKDAAGDRNGGSDQAAPSRRSGSTSPKRSGRPTAASAQT